jgi:hypothetical protein
LQNENSILIEECKKLKNELVTLDNNLINLKRDFDNSIKTLPQTIDQIIIKYLQDKVNKENNITKENI